MLCGVCKKKEATVHVCQVADDKTRKMDLCEECAEAQGVIDPAAISLTDLLASLSGSTPSQS